jgi:hypothetical protein
MFNFLKFTIPNRVCIRFKPSEMLRHSSGKQVSYLYSQVQAVQVGHTTLLQKAGYCLPVATAEHPRNLSLRQQHFANPKSLMCKHTFLKALHFQN